MAYQAPVSHLDPEHPCLRSGRLAEQDPNEVAFARWFVELEELVADRWPGLTLANCPARPYRDWFEEDDTPEQGLEEIERDVGVELDERVEDRR